MKASADIQVLDPRVVVKYIPRVRVDGFEFTLQDVETLKRLSGHYLDFGNNALSEWCIHMGFATRETGVITVKPALFSWLRANQLRIYEALEVSRKRAYPMER